MTPTQRKAAERLMEQMGNDHRGYDPDFNEAAAILRELLAEPVQDPVAAELPAPQLLVESAQGFVEGWTRSQVRSAINLALLKRRYAAPQQRKPLTDEQIDDLWRGQSPAHLTVARAFARAIERAITGEPT